MFNLNLGKKLGVVVIIVLGVMSSAKAVVLDSFDYAASLLVNTGAPVAQQQFNDINAFNGDVSIR